MHTNRRFQVQPFAMLVGIGVVAMFCTRISNNAAGSYLHAHWLERSSMPAALVACGIYLPIRPARPFALSSDTAPRRRVLLIAALWLLAWLAGSVLYAAVRGLWGAHVTGVPALVGFIFFGPLAEELLFRGAVFELAERTWSNNRVAPILLSSTLFSAYHLQLHGYRVNPFVLFQLTFTLPLGYVLARLRSLTASIWPGLVVHMATNIPHAFGASTGAA